LNMKHFPVRTDPAVVGKRSRTLRAARARTYTYNRSDVRELGKIRTRSLMKQESMLGKVKLHWAKMSGNVFKFYQNGQFTSTCAIFGDKVHVPLHSHIDGAERKIVNATTCAVIGGEITPTSEDGGVFFTGGVVKAGPLRMRSPKNEMVVMISFTNAEEVEPSFSVGYCSSSGICDYASDYCNCGGLVIAVDDGAVVGTHIAGGDEVNRFEPMTEDRIKRFKASAPTLAGMDFP